MPMKDQLVSHFSLEEASGPRVDDIGGNTLTDNNTVTQNPGKIGNAAQFTAANTEYLSCASNAGLSITGALWIGGWVYFDAFGVSAAILSKMATTSHGYLLYTNGAVLTFQTRSSGTAKTVAGPTLSVSTWYRVDAWYDPVAQTNYLQVNNGSIASTANTVGISADASAFQIGASGITGPMNGRLDEFSLHARIGTPTERTDLYNGGSGLAYSQWSGTYTLSGTGTPAAATGSGAGLAFVPPTSVLSGTGTPAAATGTGTGLVNTAPVYTLSGSATPQAATGSGVGLVNTNPVYHLSGSAQAGVATGSGSGLTFRPTFTLGGSATAGNATGSGAGLAFLPRPVGLVALTLAPRSLALTLQERA